NLVAERKLSRFLFQFVTQPCHEERAKTNYCTTIFELCVPCSVAAVTKYIPGGTSSGNSTFLFVPIVNSCTFSPNMFEIITLACSFDEEHMVIRNEPWPGFGNMERPPVTCCIFLTPAGVPNLITEVL